MSLSMFCVIVTGLYFFFFLYCLTGSKFRTECIRLITCDMFLRHKVGNAMMFRSAKFTDLSATSKNSGSDSNNDFCFFFSFFFVFSFSEQRVAHIKRIRDIVTRWNSQ